jgi:hypothetical protein
MSDRRINLILAATDTGSPVVSRFAQNVRRSAKDVSDANRAIYGPAVAPRFDKDTQFVRDRVAGRLQAIREGNRREQREAIVHNEVLRRTAIEGAGAGGGAIYGPAVRDRFTAEEKAVRSGLARVKAAGRAERRQQLVEAEVHNRRLSETAVEGAGVIEPNAPVYGPARRPRFDAATQAQRLADAQLTKDIRSGAREQIAESTRRRALLGDADLERNGFAGREFMRGVQAGGPRGSARLGEAEASLYKRMKDNTEGLERMLKVVRGVGAAGALAEGARIVGEGLKRLPEVTVEYREAMKNGASATGFWSQKLADTLPGIGDLAKGFRAIYDAGQYLAEKAKDEYEQRRKEIDATLEKGRQRERDRQSVVRPVLEASGNAAQSAMANRRLFMTRGDERARVEAQLAYEAEVRQIGHDTLSGSDLTQSEREAASRLHDDERLKLNQQRDARLAEAERRRAEAVYNIDLGSAQRQTEQEHAQQDRLFQIKSEGGQRDLQLSGYLASARLAALRDENQQAITELGRRYHEETRDLKDGSQEKVAAERRYREELAALRAKGYADEAAQREQDRREDAASGRAFARAIEGTQAQAIADRLRAAGASEDADKVQRAEAHRQRLREIDEQEQEAKEKRGEWYARGGSEQFRQQRLAENDAFAASEAASTRERARQFLPSLFAAGTASLGLSGAFSVGAAEARLNQRDKEDKAAAEVAKLRTDVKQLASDIASTLKAAGVTLVSYKPAAG